MKIKSLSLTNFRQFKGEQSFDFTSDVLKPVSLLFGANGAGKTTLLNAFTWVLYGLMSDDVEEQHRMVTDEVWRSLAIGSSTDVAAELTFDHEGASYRLLRRASVRKLSDDQLRPTPQVQLWVTSPGGSSELVGAPQEQINTILPMGISRFFFFNGERIEKLVQRGAYGEVQQDIKALLDLGQVERALDHLPKVDRRLTADLKKHGGEKASEIQNAIDNLRESEISEREQLKVLEGDLAILNEERERIVELLRQHASVAPIQGRRDATVTERDAARRSRDAALLERASLVASRGFIAFTSDLATRTTLRASELYQKGSLPAPLKREFVDQLLKDRHCICGTELLDQSEPWTLVNEWRQRAGLQAVETAWQQLSGQISALSGARRDLQEALQTIVNRINLERDRVVRLEEILSELDGQLKNNPLEDVQDLENKRIDLDTRIGVKQQRIGSSKTALMQILKEIEQKTAERGRAEVTDELAAKARSRSDLVQSVRKALEEILEIRSEDMRERLDAELKETFGKITIKRYIPKLSKDFELTLLQNVNGVELAVPKSTGENQILSLSFVAAVSKLAREIRKEHRAEGSLAEDAGTYPIVMDAAFGSLDENYQREVSRVLAEMAPQLIVLVSKSQGLGQVVSELMPYVSHLGVIVTHTSTTANVSDSIELEGMSHPYIESSSDSDYAELTVIK